MGIDPEGMPGLSQQLLLELSSGITKLPALGTRPDQAGNMVNYYLERQPFWKELKASAKAKSEVLASCLLYTSPSPRDPKTSRMPSSA